MPWQDELNDLVHEQITLLRQRMAEMRLSDVEMELDDLTYEQITLLRQQMEEMGRTNLKKVERTFNPLEEFVKIAGMLLQEEGEFSHPLTNENIPYEAVMARQIMGLFAEGVFHANFMCIQKQIPSELKLEFLQVLAQDVYNQAKLTAIQGQTSGTQLPRNQQIQQMVQTIEASLLQCIEQKKIGLSAERKREAR